MIFSTNSRLYLFILGMLILSGCQIMDKKTPSDKSVEDISINALQNQNRQINQAIALLERGKTAEAERLIEEVLLMNPKHENALFLNSLISQPVEKIFATKKATSYKIKNGDSLGAIAKNWLGNNLYFVSLAKLNKIKNPAKLTLGQVIKIPLFGPGLQSVKDKRRSNANINLLKQYRKKGRLFKGLEKANSLFLLPEDFKAAFHLQQLLLDDLADTATSITARQNMVKFVRDIIKSSRNQAQRSIYQRFINAQNRQLFVDESQALFKDKRYMEAANKLIEAKKLDENISQQTAVYRMESLLVNKLHEQAIVFYRSHSLEKALGRWNLILALNPNHALAKKYKERTVKLIQKLEKL